MKDFYQSALSEHLAPVASFRQKLAKAVRTPVTATHHKVNRWPCAFCKQTFSSQKLRLAHANSCKEGRK